MACHLRTLSQLICLKCTGINCTKDGQIYFFSCLYNQLLIPNYKVKKSNVSQQESVYNYKIADFKSLYPMESPFKILPGTYMLLNKIFCLLLEATLDSNHRDRISSLFLTTCMYKTQNHNIEKHC